MILRIRIKKYTKTVASIIFIILLIYEIKMNFKRKILIDQNSKIQENIAQYFKSNQSEKITNTENQCELVQLNEWDSKIKKLFKKIPRYKSCETNNPLSFIENNTLYIDQRINQTVYNNMIDKCEMAAVLRDVSRVDGFSLGDYVEIHDSIDISNHEFVKVRCYTKNLELMKRARILKNKHQNIILKYIGGYLILYEYVHYHLIFNKLVNLTLKSQDSFNNNLNSSSKLNVMVLVLDGVSLSSMKRALPNTLNYLKSLQNFFLFEKHHVTGENTFQNLVPMLANLNVKQIDDYKNSKKTNTTTENNASKTLKDGKKKIEIEPPYDDINFIWKEFKKRNYVTYFSEEWKESTFYNLKFGFKEPPTDYYLRPYWLALYDSLSYNHNLGNSNPKPCYYNKLLHELSFDWLLQLENFFSTNFNNTISRFGVVKVNEMSHDYLERLFWIDDDLKKLLTNLFSKKFLNNTLFILMGDHGHRFHSIRQTFIGKMEEKLPMFGMIVPNSILENNESLKKNIIQNTKKLTTWFDVYETFTHLLLDQSNLNDINKKSNYFYSLSSRKESNQQNGFTLFEPVPDRNCQNANIPDYLCSCGISLNINTNESLIQNGAKFLLNYINDILLGNYQNICMRLALSVVIDAQYLKNSTYSIIFKTTSPSDAIFDGTFQLVTNPLGNNRNDYNFRLLGNIIRINTYGTTSKCITVYFLKNYCYCLSNKQRLSKKSNRTVRH